VRLKFLGIEIEVGLRYPLFNKKDLVVIKPPSVAAFFPNAEVVHSEHLSPNPPLNRIDQIALVVHDIDSTITALGRTLGWGPFYIATIKDEQVYRGIPSKYILKVAFCLVGSLEIELLQLLDGETPHKEFMEQYGTGLFHLRLVTDDIERDLSHLRKNGVCAIWSYIVGGQIQNAYTDSQLSLGFRTELIRTPEQIDLLHKKNNF